MQNDDSTDKRIEQLRSGVLVAAYGALIALQHTGPDVPGRMLDAAIVLGRTSFEAVASVAPASSPAEGAVMDLLREELLRLDRQRAEMAS